MAKTKSVDVKNESDISVNFGNVEALKLRLANDSNKSLRAIKDLLIQMNATLIRLEGKYDANAEAK